MHATVDGRSEGSPPAGQQVSAPAADAPASSVVTEPPGPTCSTTLDVTCVTAHDNQCYWETAAQQPATPDDLAALKRSTGMEPPDGGATGKTLQIRTCTNATTDGSPPPRRWITTPVTQPTPPPPPPPDPAVLAATATKMLKLPALPPKIGPSAESAVVHRPLWLWVTDPGPRTSTLTLRGVTVTVTARINTVTWTMGEPLTNPDQGPSPIQTVTCTGPGITPPDRRDLPVNPRDWKPACGYTYQWVSKKVRTNGVGRWPVTATTNWTADWTSNTGAGGTITLAINTNTTVEIGQIRTTLINNPKTPPKPGG